MKHVLHSSFIAGHVSALRVFGVLGLHQTTNTGTAKVLPLWYQYILLYGVPTP